MEQQTIIDDVATGNGRGISPTGLNLSAIKDVLPQLEHQCSQVIGAQETFRLSCKRIGEKAGIEPSVLAAYIRATVKESNVEARTAQLHLLFETL